MDMKSPSTTAGDPAPPPPPPGAPGELRLLKAGFGFFQPDIWIVDTKGSPRVWKSWHRRPAIERATFGVRLARREGRVLRALSAMREVPRFLSHPQPFILEMTLLDAEPVPEIKQGNALTVLYFDRLWVLLSLMHQCGINHGDLRRKNLLRAPGDPDTPRMVDFTQSFCFTPPVRGLRAVLLKQAIRVDRVTFLKLKRWYLGAEALTAEEQADFEAVPWHLRLGRTMRKKIYRPIRRAMKRRR
jgi:tRNA A-37 threonylcarbamoyl transferase component Bud32